MSIFEKGRSADSYTGKRYTVEAPNTRDATHGPAYTVPETELIDADKMTLYHNFLIGCGFDDGNRPCYGRRTIDPATGKAGAYEWFTYNQIKTRMDDLASGMVATCGLKRQEKVPLYDTLGPDAVPYVINQTELRVLFCGKKQFDVIMDCAAKCPSLKIMVLLGPLSDEQQARAAVHNIEVKYFDEVEAKGKAEPCPADPALPSDVSTLCYTSGAVGDPKGIYPEDIHISYLPLVHVLERIVLALMHHSGAAAGFYQGDVRTLMDDIAVLKPSIFVTIVQGVEAAGGIKKSIFEHALAVKLAGVEADESKTNALWDTVVFDKLRQVLGGNIRIIFSGSAPLSAEVKKFMKAVFCCEIVEGYGMSESAAAVCIGGIEMPTESHVGPPVLFTQVQLEDVPEMGYTSQDKPRLRGEILVKGPEMFTEYYNNPEMTREAIDERGWFHTGDIGCWNADGTLSIIDRKKNIFKLAQGEYVAAEKIENAYSKCKYVAQLFVYGDSLQSCLVGVVVPDAEVMKVWARERGLSGDDATKAKVLASPKYQKDVRDDMERVAKEAQLCGFERVRNVHFHPKPFSSDEGLVTPTFKLKRPQLKAYFQPQIDELYREL
ncbi:hypothetical protein PHYSODRAFT_350011 [Phytophthora sojae]|uniref:AMP-dependent synthetase/ligase domain-containing protein n=1 Tax=Phytophthora sojae (strain P6497) TaxID=1094619 RepID=G4YTV1_PHYSP|nr:hypothetical protein PHYSODRAFT_350011 [Phytophthora sojae]EGZ24837.1 hypothetical protein PHYSODRAFT_350011 [Phytophthora sojae]|eukprot:XP_009520125.1 hypothetical protein PHYSODRAFT_350011 [Phytophthora sojae]